MNRPPRARVFRIPFSWRGVRTDVDAELRFHIKGRIEELMSKGWSRGEAERGAHASTRSLRSDRSSH